jgi:hypothetical protein
LLSRFRRIWNRDVAAEAVEVKPKVSSRQATAILTKLNFSECMGNLLGRNVPRPLSRRRRTTAGGGQR